MARKKSDADIEKVIYNFADAQKFLGISHQVNYQYLVIYIPLALLVAAQTKYLSERIFTPLHFGKVIMRSHEFMSPQ